MFILLQEPIPTVESFLHILLEEWNGDDYRREILNLLSHLTLQPFDGELRIILWTFFPNFFSFLEFRKAFLEPIRRHFVSKDRSFKVTVNTCTCVVSESR